MDKLDARSNTLRKQAVDILKNCNDMTIATIRADGFPQATTVSYVSEGLDIYFGAEAKSQKTKNLTQCNKVSLTVNLPYKDWDHICGLSVGGTAERVTDSKEVARLSKLMFAKFPESAKYAPPTDFNLVVYRVKPKVISVLDYAKGFGHMEQFDV